MSVLVLNLEEFGSISSTLRTGRTSLGEPIFPLSMAERYEQKVLDEPLLKRGEEEYRLSLIEPFVYRLYIANVLAEQYTYMKDGQEALTVPLIDLPKATPLSLGDLLETLDSLSYNVITNGGNSFLGEKDQEKLERIVRVIQRELLRR